MAAVNEAMARLRCQCGPSNSLLTRRLAVLMATPPDNGASLARDCQRRSTAGRAPDKFTPPDQLDAQTESNLRARTANRAKGAD